MPVAVSDDQASPGDGGTTCGTPVKYGDPEGQARGEYAEYELPGQGDPDEQSPEDHHEKQEETGPLRFKHSVLLAGVWRQG